MRVLDTVENPIVAKFGGSVLADTEGIRRSAEIIHANPARRYVIVSAPGKRFPSDEKITDTLFACHNLVTQGLPFDEAFDKISARFTDIGSALQCQDVNTWLGQVYNGIRSEKSQDWVASRGEWVTAQVMAQFLDASFIDASRLIRFKQNGTLSPLTYDLIKHQLSGNSVYVIPGYYGADRSGNIQVFARGGSDITGAIIAKGVHAGLYENWKDVTGVLAADPRIVANPRNIPEMTYGEMRGMSYRGADVLQSGAIAPVVEAGIPIRIANTAEPDKQGTLVVAKRDVAGDPVIGIAGKGGFLSFQIQKIGINEITTLGRKLLAVFEKYGLPFEQIPTGLDAVSVIISKDHLNGKQAAVLQEIQTRIQPNSLSTVDGLGLVCVVGEGIQANATDVNARLFQALQSSGIAVKAQSYATNGDNIVVAVDESRVSDTVKAFYNSFIK